MSKIRLLTLLSAFLIGLHMHAEVYSGIDGNITWSLDSETGVMTLSGKGEMNDYHVVLPISGGREVNLPWYKYLSIIKEIVIQYGVTSIGSYAFEGCSSLTSVTIPNSVLSIGNYAFEGCSSLTCVTIPNSVTSIGNFAFYSCSSLTSIYVFWQDADKIPVISSETFPFQACDLYVPDGTMEIYQGKFYWNTFKNIPINIPNNEIWYKSSGNQIVQPYHTDGFGASIISNTYSDGKGVIKFDGDVTSIGYDAFAGAALKTIILPNSVTSIGANAFAKCTTLESVMIPHSVISIGDVAFADCQSLTSVSIPNSVKGIGASAFRDCYSLTNVFVMWQDADSIPEISSGTFPFQTCDLYVPDGTIAIYQDKEYWNSFRNMRIPNNEIWYTASEKLVETTGYYSGLRKQSFNAEITSHTFSNGKGIIKFNADVISIDDRAFSGCSSLTSVTIPNTVICLGEILQSGSIRLSGGNLDQYIGIFQGCTNLESIEIPNSVTLIGDYAFSGCSSLTSLTIPNSVTSIGKSAFSCCGLTSIRIPNSVTSVGGSAFSGCSRLTSVTIPNSVTSIGYRAFGDCSSLTSITIPNSVTSIGVSAFDRCSSLTSITIPNSVTSIGESAFYLCSSLISITIPNSVTSIGNYAFSYCSSLTSITIPNSVTSIGERAFDLCSSLISITIPNSVTSIGERAFSYSGLTSLTVPNSVTSIGERAFLYCESLVYVTIPNSVTSIGEGAFSDCSSMTSVHVRWNSANEIPDISSKDFPYTTCDLYVPAGTKSMYQGKAYWKGFRKIIEEQPCNQIVYTASSKLEETTKAVVYGLHTNAFNASIVSHTFSNGKGVITFSTDVTIIGERAFYEANLSGITIPNSVTTIGERAFAYCTNLAKIDIPSSVTSIDSEAFVGCARLTSITVESNNAVYDSRNNCNAIIETKSNTLIRGSKNTSIPNTVTSIGSYAFHYCGLSAIKIPSSVTSIGNNAFVQNDDLTSITIPQSVTLIDENVLWGCDGLASIKVESGNPVYDSRNNCNAIIETKSNTLISGCKNTTIPNSVTVIGREAFYALRSLKTIKIPNSVTEIGSIAFGHCDNLTNVTIPNSVTKIGSSAFDYCESLTSITIPNSVTYIGSYAFADCKSLTSITIPNSVTYIGSYAFKNCMNLKSVEVFWNKPLPISENTFSNYESATLYVPMFSQSLYKSDNVWKNFYQITSRTKIKIDTLISVQQTDNTIFSVTLKVCDISDQSISFEEIGIKYEDTYYKANADGIVVLQNMKPNTSYYVYGYLKFEGEYYIAESAFKCQTKSIKSQLSIQQVERTQTTLTLKVTDISDKSIPFQEIGIYHGATWSHKGTYDKPKADGTVMIKYLEPGTIYSVYGYVKYGGEYYYDVEDSFSTLSLNPKIAISDIKANGAQIKGSYDKGDAPVYKTTISTSRYETETEYRNDRFMLTGLNPDQKYTLYYRVYYHYGKNDENSGYEAIERNFTTPQLKMTTLAPRNVSSTSSIVAAETNLSDDETGAGFEWRKYDAPESLPSSKGKAIVYDGRMEGKINNLQPVYYKMRPYYESASGKVYYGEWMTFDPTDFSYFEPTVHTYDFMENPAANAIEVRGYVMQGTDDVLEQGFEYWKTDGASSPHMKTRGGNEVMRIQATGQMMIATLKDLDYASNYVVRAYVTTVGGTIYGEERTFTTPEDPTSGIGQVSREENVTPLLYPEGIYTMAGLKIEHISEPGIYICNGKKVLITKDQLPME